jgi:general transcription factor 3C polypeptide 3 (transcription factor C subunit 4)
MSWLLVIDSRKKRLAARGGNDAGRSGSLFEEKGRKFGKGGALVKAKDRLSSSQLKELEEGKVKEVLRGFRRVRELCGHVFAPEVEGHAEPSKSKEEAEREWLFEAERLIETFRETRNLFLTSRVSDYSCCQSRSTETSVGIAEHPVPGHDSQKDTTKGRRAR